MSTITAQLAARAQHRVQSAYRPATQRTYDRMFYDFLGFLVAAGQLPTQLTHEVLLAFMEYLVQNQLPVSNIAKYMAAVKAQFIIFGLDHTPFSQTLAPVSKIYKN